MLAYQLLTGRFPFWEDVRNETLSDVWKVRLAEGRAADCPLPFPRLRVRTQAGPSRVFVCRPAAARAVGRDCWGWLPPTASTAACLPPAPLCPPPSLGRAVPGD
jgi:hypothetical protein